MRKHIQKFTDDPKGLDRIIDISGNLISCIDSNTEKMVEALNKSSKSSNFLAWVGICVGIIGAIATGMGSYYGYISLIK